MSLIITLSYMLSCGQASSVGPAWLEEWGPRLAQWEAALAPLRIEHSEVARLISLIDPRPLTEFRHFSDERLDPYITEQSKDWFGRFLRKEFNPFENGAGKPTRYSLAPSVDRQSILLYEWSTPDYWMESLEASSAMLLRVRPKHSKWPIADGLGAKDVQKTIDSILNPEGDIDDEIPKFRLPERVLAGRAFTNNRDGRVRFLPPVWNKGIVGFYTKDALCLLLIKEWSMMQTLYVRPDNVWLPVRLFSKDSNELVIEKLWGKPYPRAISKPK